MELHILCIDDDEKFLTAIKARLKEHYRIITTSQFEDGLSILRDTSIDIILLDLNLGQINGINVLKRLKKDYPNINVVMLSGHKDRHMIVEAIKNGADDYLVKDCQHELLATLEKIQKKREVEERCGALFNVMKGAPGTHPPLGESPKFVQLLKQADKLKGYQANVMIEGENGTGKEMLARYIHNLEAQPKRPFIAVNCAAIPETLVESELFGHEKGAFSGATERKIGKFELANGGDIFLDEINSLKLELQAKLLRALQEKEFDRVGGSKPIRVDIRVISASNVDLLQAIAEGKMREDLYHRLKVVSLQVPPLRERVEDIPLLVDHFIRKHSRHNERRTISRDALQALMAHKWPGNVRELENMIQCAIIMSEEDMLIPNDFPKALLQKKQFGLTDEHDQKFLIQDDGFRLLIKSSGLPLSKLIQAVQQQYARQIVEEHRGNKAKASQILGISRPTLYKMLAEDRRIN